MNWRKTKIREITTNPRIWILAYIIAVILVAVATNESQFLRDWLNNWAIVISFIFTGLLTIGLLILYKQQNELWEAQYEPLPWLEGYKTEKSWTSTDNLVLILSNLGDGVARNLRARASVEFPRSQPDIFEIEPFSTNLEKASRSSSRGIDPYKAYLDPKEKSSEYKVGIVFLVKEGPDEPKIRRRLRTFPELFPNVNWIRVTIFLEYEDQLGEDYSIEIIDDYLPIRDGYDLNEMLVFGERTQDVLDVEELPIAESSVRSGRESIATDEVREQYGIPVVEELDADLDEE